MEGERATRKKESYEEEDLADDNTKEGPKRGMKREKEDRLLKATETETLATNELKECVPALKDLAGLSLLSLSLSLSPSSSRLSPFPTMAVANDHLPKPQTDKKGKGAPTHPRHH
jgi:hypothetical protein